VLVSLGPPDRVTERRVLTGEGGQRGIAAIQAVGGPREWADAQRAVDDVFVSPLVVEYVLDVLAASRQHPDVSEGASPRAGLALLRISRALAALDDRTFVLPDDVKAAAPAVLAHRLGWKGFARSGVAHSLVDEVVRTVRVPVP
jgi:MoxR-like ATPase